MTDATIVMLGTTRLSYDTIMNHCPKTQLITSMGTGVDNIDAAAIRERGITLCNVPAQNIESVSEHAIALLMALKRRIVPAQAFVRGEGQWTGVPTSLAMFGGLMPRTNADEVVGIVGYGGLGKHIEKLAHALGMTVLIAERKGETTQRLGRETFEHVLKTCTVLICTCPLDDSTRDMISTAELSSMQPSANIINVGRGGVINEAALVTALKEHTIAGAATDVFETEPVTAECPLLEEGVPNLLLTPHVAWFSSRTIDGAMNMLRENVEGFLKGEPQNVVIAGRALN